MHTSSRTFFKYVSSNMLGMLSLSLYILADTCFISMSMGTNGLAGLNLVLPIYSFLAGIGLMLGIGGATRYSMLHGEGNKTKANQTFTHALMLGAIAAIIFALIGIFATPGLCQLLGASGSVLPLAETYLQTILSFAPFFLLNNILLAFVRNDGKPRLAMAATLAGSFANIILDYIMIFPLGWGMFGAAFATGLSPIISICCLIPHLLNKDRGFHIQKSPFQFKMVRSITSLGLSALITESASGFALMAFNTVLLRLTGTLGVAAYGVIANISLIVIALFTGIAQGMQPLVSQAYGRGAKDLLKRYLRLSAITAATSALFLYVVLILLRHPIVGFFNQEADPIFASYATTGLCIYGIGFLLAGLNIVFSAYFSAVERPAPALLLSSIRGFAALIPLVFLLPLLFHVTGVWLAFPLTELVAFLPALFIFKKRPA